MISILNYISILYQGSVSFVLMSTLVNPCQVYLRAGWSLGNVKDRYVFAGPGGDQVVGRAVSGLPITTICFSLLPPHFTRKDLESLITLGDYGSMVIIF